MEQPKSPTLLQSLIPIIFLVVVLVYNVLEVYGDNALSGSNQMALLLAASVAGLIAVFNGHKWKTLIDGIVKSIATALPAIIILLLIGALAGTWLLSGIVPAMIYYGLEVLNPSIFLVATCIICSIVSIATGSSWSTVATVGIALLGIGKALGMAEGVVAGAIISGAYFGDKMSPLSDTTNLAPAMAGTDLFTHIRYMAWTTVPSISIALLIFLILGLTDVAETSINQVGVIQEAITSQFTINGWLFLVPLIVIFLIVKKIPAIPALLAGALLGGVFGIIFQPEMIKHVTGEEVYSIKACYQAVMDALTVDMGVNTNNKMVNELLSSSGMNGMLGTIWLILCAMCFGGIMEATGMLRRITQSIIGLAKSTGSLIATTASSCVVFNMTASDQYLAIVVPGRMFAEEYKERGLHPKVLSRTLEDSGTVTSALIPWNTCGAYHSGVLGVATGEYFMYCFFNLVSPLMTMLFGFIGFKIAKLKPAPKSTDTTDNPKQ